MNDELDESFALELHMPIAHVWLKIRKTYGQAQWTKMTNQEKIDLCVDFDQLTNHGYQRADRLLHRAVDLHGRQTVMSFLSRTIKLP